MNAETAGSRSPGIVERIERRPHPLLAGWRPYLILAAAGVVIYGRCVFFGFTYFDDYKIIVEDHEFIGGPEAASLAFAKGFANLYRPVLRLTWILDAALGGMTPAVYHLSNLVFHLAACCLVFAALLRLSRSRGSSFFLALFFACHPLLTQAVVWIPGRNDTLVTLFVLLAFLSLDGLAEKRGVLLYAWHFIAFALALFTKETALLFPVLGLFHVRFVRRERILSYRTAVLVSGWAAVAVLWLLARRAALEGVSSPDAVGLDAFWKSLPALPAILGKTVLPLRLSGLATFEWISITAGALFAAVLVLLCALGRDVDYRRAAFGALWFLLFLLPTFFYRVATADDHYEYLEHRAYLPLFGLLVLLAALPPKGGPPFRKKPVLLGALAVLLLFGFRAFLYSASFRDMHVFWRTAVEYDPTRSNFHSVQGKLYYEARNYEKAEYCFRQAIELSTLHDPMNYKNLGVIYKEMNRPDESLAMYEKAVSLAPDRWELQYTLGKAYYERKAYRQAEAALRKVVEAEPRMTDAYIYLTGIYSQTGEIEKAIGCCQAILKVDPRHFHALNILGSLYRDTGEWDLAVEMWTRITRTNPDHLPAYESLMYYYLDTERPEEARIYGEELLNRGGRIDPDIRERLGL